MSNRVFSGWSVVDDFISSGNRSEGDCVVYDLRNATAEPGRQYFGAALENMRVLVERVYAEQG